METAVGLITATLLMLLAIQAEPITAVLGFVWAFVHLVATVMFWNEH
jgi:hypothetical protein